MGSAFLPEFDRDKKWGDLVASLKPPAKAPPEGTYDHVLPHLASMVLISLGQIEAGGEPQGKEY